MRLQSLLFCFAACTVLACGGSGSEAQDASQDTMDVSGEDVPVATDLGGDLGTDLAPPPVEPAGPGWVTIHRLNRTEYNNTVRDLLKDESEPANSFPDDDQGYGFDNIADVLAVSPLLFEKLERASESLIDKALLLPIDATYSEHFEAEYTEATTGGGNGDFWNLWSNGSLGSGFTVEKTGVYLVTVRAGAQQGGPDPALMSVEVNGVGANFDVVAPKNMPALYQIAVSLQGSEEMGSDGTYDFAVSFLNDYYDPDNGIDRNLLIDWILIEGPFDDSTIAEHIQGDSMANEAFVAYQSTYVVLEQPGELERLVNVPKDGAYDLSLRFFGISPDDELPKLVLKVDGDVVAEVDVEPSLPELAATWTERVDLTEGQRNFSLSIANSEVESFPSNPRTVYLDFMKVVGPMDFSTGPPPEVREEILLCEPVEGAELDCVRSIIDAFAQRAWRRPLDAEEVDRLAELYSLAKDSGADYELSIRTVLKAVLLSPNFLYRVEVDPDLLDSTPHKIGQYELASRLSYALWSSMPDQELFDRAAAEALHEPEVLVSEVNRMLLDPRSKALVDNFAGQWLYLRNLDDVVRDSTEFPDFDEELAQSMRLETELLFDHFLSGQFDFREFWAPGYTFVNDRLAAFYGIEGVVGSDHALIPTQGTQRVGLLTHGSILTVTSHTFRTSPVNRGKWIMGQLLCAEPPPPPAGVDTSLESEGSEDMTIKEQMAAHRDKPECVGCHMLMDPLGLSLEHFDAVGKWRDEDNGHPVEAFDELPDGTMISGAEGVTAYVQANPNTMSCVAEQLFTYMIGRGVTNDDHDHLEAIMEAWETSGYTLEALLTLIATSDPFTMREAPQVEEETE